MVRPVPAPEMQHIYRRRRIVAGALLLLALLILGLLGYGGLAATAATPRTAPVLSVPEAVSTPAVPLNWPTFGEGAIGALGFDGVLATGGPQDPVPIASITKVVTALVVLDAHPLGEGESGPVVPITDQDVDHYYDVLAQDGSVAPVVAGTELTQRELLTAMLVPSANNYSITLAVWAFGSVDAYLDAARAWLDARGFGSTQVADTSGLSAENVSTPADLVGIGSLAAADPVIAAITAQPTVDLPVIGTLVNTNKLLGRHGVDGMKTGTTDEAGACLLFTADLPVGDETVTLVGVVLGGDTHAELNAAIASLIESVGPAFQMLPLTEAGHSYGTYSTAWGESAELVAAEGASLLVWQDTPVEAALEAEPITTAEAGERAGTLRFSQGDRTVEVPLVLTRALEDPDLGWRLSHPGELFG